MRREPSQELVMTSKTIEPHSRASAAAPPNGQLSNAASSHAAGSSSKPTGRTWLDLGSIEQLQILNEHGVVDESLDPNLPEAELRKIYRAMVLTRKLDIRMLNMQRQGEVGTFAPGFGQEATQIGQIYPLEARDWCRSEERRGGEGWRGRWARWEWI